METMSVTRALAEIKRLDDRIQRGAQESVFVVVLTGKNASQKVFEVSTPVDVAKAKIQSSYDTMAAMFEKRAALKSAVVLSNAMTTVQILGKEVSVAEAIEMKSSVQNKQALLQVMKQQYAKCNNAVSMLNAKLDEAIESNLKTIYGSDKSKADPSAYESIAKPQREQKEASLLDPVDIVSKIAALTEEISVITTELDFTLSESNARTTIQVRP